MSAAYINKNYSFDSPRPQYFSFPPDVITYLWKNPKSGKVLCQLHQTCKYFFSKQKVLLLDHNVHGHYNGDIFYLTVSRNKKTSHTPVKIESMKGQFWPTGSLVIENLVPQSFDKIYRCTVHRLVIHNTILSIKDFELLVSENKVKDFDLGSNSCINYSDGSHVTLDVVLQMLPNVENFWYKNKKETFSSETLQNMAKTIMCIKMDFCFFYVLKIAENFYPSLLCKFYQKHPQCSFKLYIVNERCYEIKAAMETELKNISENNEGKKLDVTLYAQMGL